MPIHLTYIQKSNIPCINSLDSFLWTINKEKCAGALRRVSEVCPSFPLIPISYFTAPIAATFVESFPLVLKVGSASQGLGKARIMNQGQWNDTLSLLGMMEGQGFTTEPFIDWVGDVRVQKVKKDTYYCIGLRSFSSS